MKHSTKTTLVTLLVTLMLIAIGAIRFMVHGQPAKALAQTGEEATWIPIATKRDVEAATPPVTTTMSITDFDNHIFILSLAVRPERFVNCVDNPYYPLLPGTVYTYEKETDEGLETTTITVTNQTKQVMGITATAVHDTVRLEGEIKEDTSDWYAQDKSGNVWYLGEETAEYENGEIVSTEGSWEAGIDGAVPGIIMLADPLVGDTYRQEYLKDEATDMATVLSLNESLSLPFGDFDDALMTADYNPLSGDLEHKFYAKGIGIVAEMPVGGTDLTRLIAIDHDNPMQGRTNACGSGSNGIAFIGSVRVPQDAPNLQELAQVSKSEAEEIALNANPNASVDDTELDVENGFLVYEIEMDNGTEMIVDAGDATLLATVSEVDEADEEAGDDADGEAEDETDDLTEDDNKHEDENKDEGEDS